MTTDALIILAGILVALLPHLGFPTNWDKVFLTILGFFIVALGIAVRRKQVAQRPEAKPTHFTESQPTNAHHEGMAQ